MFFSSKEAKMTCGLKVDTTDPGWYKSITKILRKIKGASYNINVEEGMAYISGRVNPSKLLRKLKSEKYADLCWVMTGNQLIYSNGSLALSQPYAGYWNNHHYDHHHHHPVPMLPNSYSQRPPMMSYSYPHHDYRHYGYWDDY